MSSNHGGRPSNISVLWFCLNCISHSSAVSKHEILRIPPLLTGREKDLPPPPLKTGAGKKLEKKLEEEKESKGTLLLTRAIPLSKILPLFCACRIVEIAHRPVASSQLKAAAAGGRSPPTIQLWERSESNVKYLWLLRGRGNDKEPNMGAWKRAKKLIWWNYQGRRLKERKNPLRKEDNMKKCWGANKGVWPGWKQMLRKREWAPLKDSSNDYRN